MDDIKKQRTLNQFLQRHRAIFESLQEKGFEKNEKKLHDLLQQENEPLDFPIPTFVPIILVWTFILLFPLVMILDPSITEPSAINLHGIVGFYFPLLMTFLIFGINQRFLVDDCIFKKNYARYFIYNLLLVGAALFMREIVFFILDRSPDEPWMDFFRVYCFSFVKGHFSIWTPIALIVLVGIVCLLCVIYHIMLRQLVKTFIRREQKRAELQYELDFLRNQLSPHFLFNTLNNISALIRIDASKAEKSMARLSQLLRVMLYQNSDEKIPVKEDLDILQKFAELEKLRLDESFDFSFTTDIQDLNIKISPLLSMPLMENALKHSLNPNGPSFAHINVKQEGSKLSFSVENSNCPRKSNSKSSGLGLNTFLKRLNLLYPNRFEYAVNADEKVYRCRLAIETSANDL